MAISGAFATTVSATQPQNANLESAGLASTATVQTDRTKQVSDFTTVQSLTNFTAMTGAFAAAWGAARQLDVSFLDGPGFPFVLCVLFALVSVLTSGLGPDWKQWLSPLFIALLNSLVLFGAVLSAGAAVTV